MKVNKKLSKSCSKITCILDEDKLTDVEKIEILTQLAVKLYIVGFENRKEILFEYLEDLYKTIEEHAKFNGVI